MEKQPSENGPDQCRSQNAFPSQDKRDRRQFIRQAGKVVFSIFVLDVVHATTLAQYDPPCSATATDSSCSSTDEDQHCGQTSGTPPVKDPDQSCNATPAGSTDQNCNVSQQTKTTGASHDEDQHCGVGGAADQACGDCDDNHDSDEHCNKPLAGGGTDSDELCGHQHVFSGSQDQVCSATAPDQGCGSHDGGYGFGGTDFDDPDQHCNPSATPAVADQNCSSQTSDSNCNSATNGSTTSPDEKCSSGSGATADQDAACGHYDKDESCNATNTDEGCGWKYPIDNWPDYEDTDQHAP
jgi:hypothetical protein